MGVMQYCQAPESCVPGMAILVIFVLSAIDFIQSAFDIEIAYLAAMSRARREGVPRCDPRKKGTFRPSS